VRAAALLVLGVLAGASPAAESAPTRRALLIGINDYALPAVTDLRGAVNDVELMARLLETRLGFDRRNIRVLADGQASREAILAAIDELVAAAQEGDSVYFHFSGHGSQRRDRNGEEADGWDETIVAWDSRTPGVPDITDDELDARFARLRTPNAVLVFDSCHSGTVTRSLSEVKPRSIPPDDRADLYPGATRAMVVVESLPHVLMTGAPSDQEALDGPVAEGFYGLFTYSLAQSLNRNGPDASAEVIHEGVKQELRRIQERLFMRPPEPQLEAPAGRMQRPLFPSAAQSPGVAQGPAPQQGTPDVGRRAWVPAEPLDAGRVKLVGGVELNAQPGSRWAVYGPGETRFEYGAALAIGSVVSVAGHDATLRIEGQRAPVPRGARAIAVTPPGVAQDVALRLVGVSPARAAALVAAMKGRLGARLTAGGEPFRFSLELVDGAWVVRDAGGLRQLGGFADGPDAVVAESAARVIQPSAQALGLLALDNLASDLKLWVGVQTASSTPAGTRAIVLVSDDPAPKYRFRRPGEPRSHENSLVVEVQADRDAYVTIVAVDSQGQIGQLFPNAAQKPGFLPEGRIPANRLVRIPDSLAPGNAAGFYWDYGPPAGIDTVRVFATSDLATAQTIRRYVGEAAANRQALGQLSAVLAASTVRGVKISTEQAPAAPQPAAPGASPPDSPALGEWSAASLVIQVHE
jgi:hypothetical protein